eukprot:symbB.v1.2.026780.t1/scaffold2704.1/size72676/5
MEVEAGGYMRRDFKDLSPESKETAREDGVLEAEASGRPLQIVLEKSDHPTLSGDKKAMQKFKAYVELATDAAQRWLPPEGELNQLFKSKPQPLGFFYRTLELVGCMAHKVSAVLPSGSAPDLRRSRLEKLLTKQAARSTPAPSEISRASSVRRAPPGGAPYVAAPPVGARSPSKLGSLVKSESGAGSDSSAVQDQLRGVQHVQSTGMAFAAILEDGSVVTWGHAAFGGGSHAEYGGDSSAVRDQPKGVQQIQATPNGAFAAILEDGSVIT